ncbi:acyltransferase ChoActase/COT/CPT [Gilbertella persicaria]|uniref:acyltransferase ChoActase/COT/CPT n=1 Tax=Gilbertella persicaria TaxID=101096 RepID=UPI00222075A2|nr:acyltransferase ChoActase/COT/CPT [Gilbertella persicaria]KAI8075381.1 acyltransferase ChoActase/COT/CPT [Gilbertella persicaria]
MAPTPKTPVDPNAAGPMLRYQKNLPKLPVPKLSETLQKYLKTVHPLLTPEEYKRTEEAVKDFEKPGGLGQELQRRLVARAQDPNMVNWMEEWWLDQAYMGYRDPVVVYVSYFYAYKDDKFRKIPAQRAAAITTAALEFKKQVVEHTLEPEYAKGEPMCMDSYKYMFNNCRIAHKPSDLAASFDPFKNTHIVAIRKNKFYVIDTVHQGVQLSTKELQAQFERVIDQAGDIKGIPVGVLTSENRDKWTDHRDLLLAANPINKQVMSKIETASFVVCLDDLTPNTRDEFCRANWHGDGRNRFYDKPLQFIVFENGKAGFIGEHSCMDGTATCRLNEYVCDGLAKNRIQHGSDQVRSLPQPEEITFVLNKEIENAIQSAEQDFDELIAKHEMTVLAYNAFGKNLIKKFKCSPDGFAQMAIQLAYYKMFGVSRPTYESGQTRKFQRGRTETCRSVSDESVAFVKAFEDPYLSDAQKIATLRAALKSQGAHMSMAVNGHGVDRHLFGLKNSLKSGEEKPALFTDPAFAYSSHWYLSTSQLSSEHFDGYGWGQVVNDGFGVAYMVKNNALQFNIASVKDLEVHGKKYVNGTYQFKQCLEDACNDMRDVLQTELSAQAKL